MHECSCFEGIEQEKQEDKAKMENQHVGELWKPQKTERFDVKITHN